MEGYPDVQQAQAQEFLAGPAKGKSAVIATGDFNSAADGSTTTSYADLTDSYFRDAWAVNDGDPGFTCCQNSTLTNPASQLGTRIDLILTHASVWTTSAEVRRRRAVRGGPRRCGRRTTPVSSLRSAWASRMTGHAGR